MEMEIVNYVSTSARVDFYVLEMQPIGIGGLLITIADDASKPRVGLYKILFHVEALLHNNIFCKHKHPLYCAIYCTKLRVIAPPRQILRCF